MELMSMLLFCAFVRLPLALGESDSDWDIEAKINKAVSGVKIPVISGTDHNTLKLYASDKLMPTIDRSGDHCKHCPGCVAKPASMQDGSKNYKLSIDNAHPNVDLPEKTVQIKKTKRSVSDLNNTETVEDNKLKSVKVTKYKTAEEKVYAIKVNEVNNQISEPNDGKSTCKVYSVKRAYPCESEESNLILMKRKINKKKVTKQKNTSTTTEKSVPSVTLSGFKKHKHRMESSHVPESFMTSIEELY